MEPRGHSDVHRTYLSLWAITHMTRFPTEQQQQVSGNSKSVCRHLTFEFQSNIRLIKAWTEERNTTLHCQAKLSLAIKGFLVNSCPVYAHVCCFSLLFSRLWSLWKKCLYGRFFLFLVVLWFQLFWIKLSLPIKVKPALLPSVKCNKAMHAYRAV